MFIRVEEAAARRTCNVCQEKVQKGERVIAIYTDGKAFQKRSNCCYRCAIKAFKDLFEIQLERQKPVARELFDGNGDITI